MQVPMSVAIAVAAMAGVPVCDDIPLDAGCNFGLTSAAPDIQPFVGVSIRF